MAKLIFNGCEKAQCLKCTCIFNPYDVPCIELPYENDKMRGIFEFIQCPNCKSVDDLIDLNEV